MIAGHAYSRALRAHNLTQVALSFLILEDDTDLNSQEKDNLLEIYDQFEKGEISELEVRKSALVEKFSRAFAQALQSKENTSRTARLWVQYFKLVNIIHCYLRAERTGNFELHLQSVREMIPFFHASGHLAYAKWARFHLQQMEDLKETIPDDEYGKFASTGYFTIRRSDRFWSGVSADLAIEQDLMRSMKTKGGLTTGRGITDSTLSTWIAAMPRCIKMCEAIEEFTCVKSETSDQHVDQRDARKTRDHQDPKILRDWLSIHNPFVLRQKNVLSLATGLLGDETINCDRALELGQESMKNVNGNFEDIKLKRKDRVKPLSAMSRCITVRNACVDVNPQQLFNRILCVMNSEDCLKEAFKYELAPKPPRLFNDVSLRKTNKAELAKKLESYFPCSSTSTSDTSYVLDGGYLIHTVNWPPRPATYDDAYKAYVSFIQRKFGKSCVTVFDGYRGDISTKIAEQKRQSAGKSCADLKIESCLPIVSGKNEFLCNPKNKAQLIDLLIQKLRENEMVVHQAQADADTLISETAIGLCSNNPSVTVVATDTDILTVLIARSDESNAPKLKMLKPGSHKRESKYYDIAEIQKNIGPLKDVLLFAHAMSGCDTTSAFFRKGKVKTFQCLKNTELRTTVSVFNDPRTKHNDIAKAGEAFVLHIYNKSDLKMDVDELRYFLFKQTVAKQTIKDNFQLLSLPPTKDATRQHSYRVYLLVQRWLGNCLPPCEWGWIKRGPTLVPITTELPPAPDYLLNLISCGCKKGCEHWCECRKAGLMCSAMCRHCVGQSCENSPDLIHDDDVI